MSDVRRTEVMRAELSVDVYCGDNCDEHEKQWDIQADGDMGNVIEKAPLVLDLSSFPAGTVVTVSEPLCPKCGEVYDSCMVRSIEPYCDFDWRNWAEEQYS
jgi:acetone carboxylase gamma subunit